MSNNTIWQVIHVLCILAHGGLIITAFIAFVVVGFLSFSDFDHRHLDKSSDRDMSVHILPWAAFGIGGLGTLANAVLYKRMSHLQKPILDETNQARYINQNFAYIISIFANLLVFAADVAIANAMRTKIGYKILAAPVTLAATAGFLALIAAFADISQLRGLHVQKRRQGNIIVMDTSTDSYRDEISTEAAAAGLDRD